MGERSFESSGTGFHCEESADAADHHSWAGEMVGDLPV